MVITYKTGRSLYVNLTNRCPCSCTFCIRNQANGVYGSGSLWLEREPTVRETVGSIDAAVEDDIDELVFCGYGEPTERFDELIAVAKHVRRAHPRLRIRINTNGLSDLINSRPTAGELKGLVDTVSISLNASDADRYEKTCRPKFGHASWQAVIDFAAACKESVAEVVMSVVGEPVSTPDEVEKCRAIARSVGAELRVRAYEKPSTGRS